MVLLALLAVLLISVARFTASADVVAILGILVAPVVTLGAAGFGVSVAAEKSEQAGAAKGSAAAEVAQAKTRQTQEDKDAAAEELAALRKPLEGLLAEVERLGQSAPGERAYRLNVMAETGQSVTADVTQSQIAEIRQHLDRCSELLRRRR